MLQSVLVIVVVMVTSSLIVKTSDIPEATDILYQIKVIHTSIGAFVIGVVMVGSSLSV